MSLRRTFPTAPGIPIIPTAPKQKLISCSFIYKRAGFMILMPATFTDHGPRTTDHGPRTTNNEQRITNLESVYFQNFTLSVLTFKFNMLQ